MAPDVVVLSTGVANTASVAAALKRVGARVRVTDEPELARVASLLVLPGVGAFSAGMSTLNSKGLADLVRERIDADRPTLAVCLGMQLLGMGSEESPGVPGLCVTDSIALRFPEQVRTPQFGWNDVTPEPGTRMLEPGAAYFANSYRIAQAPEGWTAAWSEHGGRFVAAMERGRVLACQFHPELSGSWGLALLKRWCETATEAASCSRNE